MTLQTILIVDDEPADLAIMQEILAGIYTLVFARNGMETLAAVLKHRPALVLLDVGLPDINGYDLCRQIKLHDTTQSIQVIFVTAYTDAAHEAAGFEAGGVDYIIKPVLPKIVRARVSAHLSMVRATVLEQSYRDAVLMLGQAGHYNDTDTGAHIWVVMRTHPAIGHEILSMSPAPVFQMAAEAALRHHEKWDGSGYPDGLKGEEIPKSARIVALADVFDALSMKRPYKEPWAIERILEYVNAGAGVHFDPALVRVFSGILPQFLAIQNRWAKVDVRQTLAAMLNT